MANIGQTQFGGSKGEINTFDLPNRTSSAFDIDAFDEAIAAHGAKFVHYRAVDNPVGMVDRFDSRRPDDDHAGASNGQIYIEAGHFSALFTGNSKEAKSQEGSLLDAATAQLTPTRNYCGSEEAVSLMPLDRLYLQECSIVVPAKQFVEAHDSGRDRLRFPATRVVACVDARNTRYIEGRDFTLVDGSIVWGSGARPGTNPENGRGTIYSVRYMYRPYWYIHRLLHEIRVSQVENMLTGNRETARMQQSCMVQREYIFENEQKDDRAPDPESKRQMPGPIDAEVSDR